MMNSNPVSPLTKKELLRVAELEKNFTRPQILERLKKDLQTAVEIELATLPVYLYTYYSIKRQPVDASPKLKLFANKAGGIIMSVAVEEMLHMSLASNILYALGCSPKVYGRSPDFCSVSGGGTNLPHHTSLGPDGKPVAIPLAPLNYETLWGFLEIEYPKSQSEKLIDDNWTTIGEFYSFIRCLLATHHVKDSDFTGPTDQQISEDYYSQNCIDTIYPNHLNFDAKLTPDAANSAAKAAQYPNSSDSHAGPAELIKVHNKETANIAIATICDQGEGYAIPRSHEEAPTDDQPKTEESHYYKFLKLQSELTPYGCVEEKLSPYPAPPPAAATQWTPKDLESICVNYPKNPTTAKYPAQLRELSNLCNSVYQYMLLMTEATYTVSGPAQVELFNVGMHKAMIWVMDKLIQGMRSFTFGKQKYVLAATFENLDITSNGNTAKANMKSYITDIKAKAKAETSTEKGDANSYTNQLKMLTNNNLIKLIDQLPDVAMLPQGSGLVPAEVKHSCMGLNACKGQGRTDHGLPASDCAGKGYCSTAVTHTCHTLNDCKHQGGCGLYGTATEQGEPGGNACKGHGSCASPINAERFATAEGLKGKSVWQLARASFESRMNIEGKTFGSPPTEAYQQVNNSSVAVGPSYKFLSEHGCVVACGSSGLSGGGNCGTS